MTRARARRAASVGLALAFLGARPASAARIDLDPLASTSLPAFPSPPPARLTTTDHMEGMHWEAPRLWGDGDAAQSSLTSETPGCLLEGEAFTPGLSKTDDPGGVLAVSERLMIPATGARIRPFLREQLVTDDGGARLIVDRGVFDRVNGRVHRIDTATVALTILSREPLVYAFRDDATLHVIVPSKSFRFAAVVRDAGGFAQSFRCTHAHAAIPLDAAGATAVFENVLPAVQTKAPTTLRMSVSVSRTSHDAAPWASLSVSAPR